MRIPFTSIQFAEPLNLLLLMLLPIFYLFFKKFRADRQASYTVSTTLGLQRLSSSWKVRYLPYLNYLSGFGAVMLILALARPQDTSVGNNNDSEGIDIVLSLDVSPSMDANDLSPSRLEAAKRVAVEFIKGRPSDRIGLVIFAGESFTQVPGTIDHNVLVEQIKTLRSDLLVKSTAIGMGLASAVNNLRNASSLSKVVILMTDGVNESGSIGPETALEIAKTYGVRVFTIGVGSAQDGYLPITDELGNVISRKKMPASIDEPLLRKIADNTGGKYYRATDNASLSKIYNEIDKLEKSKLSLVNPSQYKDYFAPFLALGMFLILLQAVLPFTVFKSAT